MNFCIVALPRSGSSYFAKLLSQSPEIYHYMSEPFNAQKLKKVDDDGIYASCKTLDKIKSYKTGLLIKELHHHLDTRLNNQLIIDDYLDHITSFYKIKLVRKNIFEQVLSACVSQITNIWHLDPGQCMPIIEVDLDLFRYKLDKHITRQQMLLEIPGCSQTIFYEDLLGNAICDWKLIHTIQPPDAFKHIDLFKHPDKKTYITNYAQLENIANNNGISTL